MASMRGCRVGFCSNQKPEDKDPSRVSIKPPLEKDWIPFVPRDKLPNHLWENSSTEPTQSQSRK